MMKTAITPQEELDDVRKILEKHKRSSEDIDAILDFIIMYDLGKGE